MNSTWHYLLPPVFRAQKGLIATPQEAAQLQLLADPLLETEQAQQTPPYPPASPLTPTPSSSPRSAGPSRAATGWARPPCAGQWGRRPEGPGHHGGTPGEGTQSGPAWGRGRGQAGVGAPHHNHEHQGSFHQGLGQEQQQEQERSDGVAPKPWPSHVSTARH